MHKRTIKISQILEVLKPESCEVKGDEDRTITHPASIDSAKETSALCFAGSTKSMAGAHKIDALSKIRNSKAGVVIISKGLNLVSDDYADRTLILVDNPRLAYIRVLRAFFEEEPKWGIHPTAIIDPDAVLHERVSIGPYTVVGKSCIGEGTQIHGHVFIYDNCTIGKNVVIYAGCVIGGKGFGFERNSAGEMEKFPQLGGLVIDDDVEIQGLCNIEVGTLDNTVIGKGTKIDSCCHIAHNTKIGRYCVITADAMFAAGVELSDYVWLSPSSVLRNRIKIGKKSQVGIGSVVVKDVERESLVMGVPARPADEFKRMLKKLKE
jgi:UDP-3-O-[3-hydroxymyristoyl] glucosamine N-acyltransferase